MTAPAGFKEFVEESSTTLLRAGWLLTGEWAAAVDLVQTALAAAWPRWGCLHERAVAYAYVRRCMMSASLRERRRKRSGEIPMELRDSDLGYRDADEAADVDVVSRCARRWHRYRRDSAVVVLRYFVDSPSRTPSLRSAARSAR